MLTILNLHKIEAKYIPTTKIRVVMTRTSILSSGESGYRIGVYDEIACKQSVITVCREAKPKNYPVILYRVVVNDGLERWFGHKRFKTSDSFLQKLADEFKDRF